MGTKQNGGLDPVRLTFPARLNRIGSGLYVRVPQRVIDYFRLKRGDTLLISIVGVKHVEDDRE